MDYSGAPTDAETAYNALAPALGADVAFEFSIGTVEEASAYAESLQMGYARATIRRAMNQQFPRSALDKIPSLERDWAITPSPRASIMQRQEAIAARMLLMHGSREEALYTDLFALLGSDLVKIRASKASERVTYPPVYTDMPDTGAFPLPYTPPKYFRLTKAVKKLNTSIVVEIEPVNGSADPLVGETYCIDFAIPGITESVEFSGTGTSFPTATFRFPHSAGAWLLLACPVWQSTQRELQIIVKPAAAEKPSTRREINKIMARHVKTTTRWRIIETTSTTEVGPWVFGEAIFGATAIGSTSFTF